MARRESYNPLLKSYPDSERVNALSIGAETLYTRLIAASDDAGRYYGDAKWVLARLFTARMVAGQVNQKSVEEWLCELEAAGLAKRYVVSEAKYIELVEVFKCLRKDVKPQVIFPVPLPESVTDAGRTRNGHGPLEPDPTQPNQEPDPTHLCSEADEPPRELSDPVVLEIEHAGPKKEGDRVYRLRKSKLDEYAESYPGVDVLAECRKARQWCVDNRQKRPVNVPRFLTNWLNTAQERSRRGGGSPYTTQASKPPLARLDEQ